jgi:hypothetical protein
MWSILLVEPVKLKNGEVLRTLEDAHLFPVFSAHQPCAT